MALTATASQQTVADILSQLKLKNHAMFQQSFNRVNLKYVVQKKKKNHLNDIISFIQMRHKGKAGIVYCNARVKCETVAEELRENGVNAAHFHAKMDTVDKNQLIHDWQSDKVAVIVATVIFLCGNYSYNLSRICCRSLLVWVSTRQMVGPFFNQIFPLNLSTLTVRFVIHHDMPKSLSGYTVFNLYPLRG